MSRMSITKFVASLSVFGAAVAGFSTAPAGAAGQELVAPFECGTEWAGTTYGGHGLDNLSLDINRTSRPLGDRTGYDKGQMILAQGNGTVVWLEPTGYNSGAGAYIEVDYGDITVRYLHLEDGSIPAGIQNRGTKVVTGQLLGLLGDTGRATHAHLHTSYHDSAAYPDTDWYRLPRENQIQITMAGQPISPGETFVSTNCGGPTGPFIDYRPGEFAYDDVMLLLELGITNGTNANSFTPGGEVTRAQMAAFLDRLWQALGGDPSLLIAKHGFTDVDPNSFADASISRLVELGITQGITPETFAPNAKVTREQMAAFLTRLLRIVDADAVNQNAPMPFTDVTPSSFAYKDIASLAGAGITGGTTPTTFSPGVVVTRSQMGAFLARLYRLVTI